MATTANLILGIDGGGTKTVACLARVDPDGQLNLLGSGRAGSSNLKAVGTKQALENLCLALEQAWSESGQPTEPAAVAVFGLSGAGRPEAQNLLQEWNQEHRVATDPSLVHDAWPVLVAGSPLGTGVALIAGTGSVAFAADSNGKTAVAGGWGYWFGDEGSAFWLGQAALRAVAQSVDGRAPPTELTPAILERLAITDSRDLLTALQDQGDIRSAIAGLADLISSMADRQDPAAVSIVSKAAKHLSALIFAVAEKLSLGHNFPLALAGGVLCGSRSLRDALLEELAQSKLVPASVEIVHEPVQGCLLLAHRRLIELRG